MKGKRTPDVRDYSRTGRNRGSKAGPSCQIRFVPSPFAFRGERDAVRKKRSFRVYHGPIGEAESARNASTKTDFNRGEKAQTLSQSGVPTELRFPPLNQNPEKSILHNRFTAHLSFTQFQTSAAGLHLDLFCTLSHRLSSAPVFWIEKAGWRPGLEDSLWISTAEAPQADVVHESEKDKHSDEIGSAGTEEGKRDACHGHPAHHHANVDEQMKQDQSGDAHTDV